MPAHRARQASQSPADRASDFEPFFKENYHAVVRLAFSVLRDAQRAQDVAQEVFLSAYHRFPETTDQAAGWVRVATVHTALNMLRSERRRERRHQALHVVEGLQSVEEAVVAGESREQVRQALGRMPRKSAALLVMRHGGMSYAEIAKSLGVKVGQVGTMLRRAESALLKEMNSAARK